MKTKMFFYQKLILIAIVICSCVRKHTPVVYDDYALKYNYTPIENQYETNNGVAISLKNPKRFGDELALEMTVENNSQKVLQLDPSVWQYLTYSSRSKSHKFNYFVNPTFRVLEIREDIEARKGYWWKRSIGSLVMISAAAVTNAALQDYDERAGSEMAESGLDNMGKMTKDAKEQKEANEKLSYWERVLFMPCEIQPGGIRAGMVFFKAEPEADYYKLFIALEDETVTHRLNQVRID